MRDGGRKPAGLLIKNLLLSGGSVEENQKAELLVIKNLLTNAMEKKPKGGKIERSNCRAEQSGNHMTEEIFCLLLRQDQKQDRKLEVLTFFYTFTSVVDFGQLETFSFNI